MSRHKHLDVIVAGLALTDIIGRPVDLNNPPKRGALKLIDSITLTTGGNVSNVGIDLAKLGFSVGAITRVGHDSLGRYVTQHYRTFGIDTEGVIIDARAQTSATMVSVDKTGERTFLHTRGCMKNFRAADVLSRLALLQKARILAVGYLGLLPETEKEFERLFRTVKEKTSLKILLDSAASPRVTPRALRGFLPYVDYFIPSYEEAMLITSCTTPESIVKFLRQAGAPHVVGVKLGAQGCYLSDGDRADYVKGRKVRRVVDATGAGDAFVAGFIAGMLKGMDAFESARVANAVAASCVSAVGASTAIKALRHYL
ncbi:MAG: carbohydrate kinase family protein [Ignavibacteriales bacterium]|nr:carbohydrate kinase family protein [Ignavibacteriales bacterium]